MMASSIVKLISKPLLNTNYKCSSLFIFRHYFPKQWKGKSKRGTIKNRHLIKSSNESLAPRAFLRSYKPYTPKENVREVILGFCNTVLGSNFEQDLPLSREDKFALLNTCFEELNHSVHNSILHKIVCVKDIIEFYETPISTATPFDELKNKELPPNLYIQSDYIRFNPETDTLFKGISAFPDPPNDGVIFRNNKKRKLIRNNSFYPNPKLY